MFADGEIFSNLKLTQAIYDGLSDSGQLKNIPLNQAEVVKNAEAVIPQLLSEDRVIFDHLHGGDLDELVDCVTAVTTDADKFQTFLEETDVETTEYSKRVIQSEKKK